MIFWMSLALVGLVVVYGLGRGRRGVARQVRVLRARVLRDLGVMDAQDGEDWR